ncbi:MAG: Clp protease N-terminal domain-containing protein [Terriglobales bacterium]
MPDSSPMFERYTTRARRTIFVARYEAAQLGATEIDTTHLLLGLIRESHHLLRYFPALDNIETLRNDVLAVCPSRETNPSPDIPLSLAAKRTLIYAAEESESLGNQNVGTEHLFLGLLREPDTAVGKICRNHGAELGKARELMIAAETTNVATSRVHSADWGQPTGCVAFIEANSGERVGITGMAALEKIPREGEFVVLDDYHGKPHRFRVVEVAYHFHRECPGAQASPHRLSSVVIQVLKIGASRSGSLPDST